MNRSVSKDDWPWEADESKRYPPKDPALLTEFEKHYPVDPVGKEADDDARVWRVYQDRMNAMDEVTISAWNDSINFLLIFAGLFSAVLTAFVMESSKRLERDPAETTADLLVALVSHFNGSGIPSRSKLSLDHFAVPASARVINAFWFLSLSLALVVSMLAILAKQWITMFSSRMRAPVASYRRWAHRHRVFRDGFDRWHLNAFVSSLSVALHSAVLLFLAGLIVHIFKRDRVIFGLVLGITILAVAFYVAATIAPLYDGTCPTATPLLIHGRLAYFKLLRAVRGLFGMPRRDLETGNQSLHGNGPPFDPDVILADGDDSRRDVQILMLMFTNLPAGHDVDAALDAVGALDPAQHNLGENLTRARLHARRRLEQFGAAFEFSSLDAAAVARALRSSIFIESISDPLDWAHFETFAAGFGSIRAHDMLLLSKTLQLQLRRQQQESPDQLEPERLVRLQQQLKQIKEEQQLQQEEQQRLEQLWGQRTQLNQVIGSRNWLRVNRRFIEEDILKRRKQQQQRQEQLQQAFDIAEAIARWRLSASSTSQHPVSLQIRASLFKGFNQMIPGLSPSQPLILDFCAALAIGFGCESNFRQRCHELVTPLAAAALDQTRALMLETVTWSGWKPLPDSVDWRLRAIDLWAHVTTNLPYLQVSTPVVGEVYTHVLTQWTDEEQWFPLPTLKRLRSVVLSPRHLNLPAAARATLWHISRPTLAESRPCHLQPQIIHDILHGVSLDEMIAVYPDIADSTFGFETSYWGTRDHGPQTFYTNFAARHNHLLAFMQPDICAVVSDAESVWETIHPYLIACPNIGRLADIATNASAVLAIYAGMSGDASILFEHLLGGGIGRRVVMSPRHRDDAFFVAKHARLFAATWWKEMRAELLQIDSNTSIWVPTESFEDAATFVRKVEVEDACPDCIQLGCAWLPRLEEERYCDAWIQYMKPDWLVTETFELQADSDDAV